MLKQAIPKTHFQPRAPCFHPLSLAAQRVSSIVGLLTLDELRVNSETPEGKIPSVRTNRESQAQPGTKVSEQSPQLHLSTAGHSS